MLSEIFQPLALEEEPAYIVGEMRGEAKGKVIGKAKGKAEVKAEMLNAMFAQNLDLALIATIASLPLPTIEEMHKAWQKSTK
jgi:hypothetical protein